MNSINPAIKIYSTELGQFYLNESLSFLETIGSDSVDLIITSPPFALEKEDQMDGSAAYIDWLNHYFRAFDRVLKPNGNIILELSSVWDVQPVKLTYAYQFVGQLLKDCQWFLLQEFFWHNPDLLPTPPEWTEGYRLKDEVSIIWWLAKQPSNKISASATINSNLWPMCTGNLLHFTDSIVDKNFNRVCSNLGLELYSARFPMQFPLFFIQLLTESGDLTLDPFAGIGTTGKAAEQLNRKWICIENEPRLAPYINIFFNKI